MRRRTLLGLGSVAMMAGCLRLDEDGEDGPAADEGAGSETGASSRNSDYPLGISEDGLSETLSQTHQNELADRSFTLEYEFEDSEDEARYDAMRVRAEDDRAAIERTHRPNARSVDFYFDGTDEWWRRIDDGTTHYGRQQTTGRVVPYKYGPNQLTFGEALAVYIRLGEYGPPVENDDEDRFRFTANAPADRDALADPAGPGDYRVNDISTELTVDDDGIIHSFGGSFDAIMRDRQRFLETTLSVSNIGATTLEEPGWVADARQEAPQLRMEIADDERAVVITHESGQPIPAGAELILDQNADGPEKSHFTRTEADLTPGDTLSAWISDDILQVSQSRRGSGVKLEQHWHVTFHLDWSKYFAGLIGDV
ncbi:DUF7537 family lipoprotein [Natrinema halophilum]|uniref:Uncharacterized protein n=1 Tax=Natrinema halophilum TaxID=1699371 RepID=A0A7D5KYK4_9EURY|nr:hypothetical protein [Natrinema halophilum]QLG50922.1 DUF603 domain-containing protein [Natrinema halophilum]